MTASTFASVCPMLTTHRVPGSEASLASYTTPANWNSAFADLISGCRHATHAMPMPRQPCRAILYAVTDWSTTADKHCPHDCAKRAAARQ